MRSSVVVTVAAWLLTVAAWADEFPYTATITSNNVTARSGPTYGTYPTERLSKHSQVEVYQEGTNGWVAIRPPEGAFDWVPAAAIKRLGSDVGQVVATDAEAWIGSNVRKVDKHVSQVQLKPGERVRILAEKDITRDDGSQERWFKIAPPAGEFRWVQAKFLSNKSPEQLAQEETAERLAREERWRRENALDPPGLLAQIRKGAEEARMAAAPRSATESADEEEMAHRDEEVEQAQFLRRRRKAAEAKEDAGIAELQIDNGQPSDSLEIEPGSKANNKESTTPPSKDIAREESTTKPRSSRISLDPKELTSGSTSATPSPAPQRRPIDLAEFNALLSQLEVDLTLMVAQDASKWSLKPLRQRAEALVEDGPSALDRGRARLVLDRIAEFEATLPPGHEEPIALPTKLPDTPTSKATDPVAAAPEFATKYDAVGYLMPVLSTRPGLPPYQLTDKDGNTLQYVTPAPGMNLNRYVKKQVGLYGQRGYVETLKKQHITAQRVVDLDRHQR